MLRLTVLLGLAALYACEPPHPAHEPTAPQAATASSAPIDAGAPPARLDLAPAPGDTHL